MKQKSDRERSSEKLELIRGFSAPLSSNAARGFGPALFCYTGEPIK
jgi:hypothetical protein